MAPTETTERQSDAVPRGLLVLLRVYLGVIFLVAVRPKFGADPAFRDRLVRIVTTFVERSAHDFYRPFLEGIVLPNAGLFAGLVMAGELLTGLALVTGTATRLAAGVAMFITLNYMLAKGSWFWTPSSNDAAFFLIGLVVLLSAAGRTLGMDRFLAKRYPGVPLW